jgi:hypothetical protein
VVNKDWEEISQDNTYFYIEISAIMFPETEKTYTFKNRKESLALDVPKIDTLSFSYSDQTDFRNQSPTPATLTVKLLSDDSIYLFTKQWKQKRTAVYALPKIPKSCRPAESYNIKGLFITTATKKLLSATAKCCPHLFIFIRLQQQFLFGQEKD